MSRDSKDIEEDIKEEADEDTEEEIFQEANKETVEEIKKFQSEKKSKQQSNPSEPKPKKNFDLTKLNTFKNKLVKEFGLEEKTNARMRTSLKFNGKSVMRLIPRKRVWYAVKHYDYDMKCVTYYTVTSEKDEEDHYKFVKAFVKNVDAPKEEA